VYLEYRLLDPVNTGLTTHKGSLMATSGTPTEHSWHQQVQYWLRAVLDQHRQLPWLDLRSCALRVPFPRGGAFRVLQSALAPLATWLMRRLIRAAAADLGVQVSEIELDVLAQVALVLVQAAL